MIAPSNFLPVIQHDEQRVTEFDQDWLVDSIYHAARGAGHSYWWAEQVGKAITHYYRDEASVSMISADEIGSTVKHVLEKIGAPDVAAGFNVMPPRAIISLPSLARQSGLELLFFDRLRDKLVQTVQSRVSAIHCYGIRPCVKMLVGSRIWRSRCQGLEHEIVSHIGSSLAAAHKGEPVGLIVS